jgi:tRNASer (uridine44-2'-O)-methyltransferase
MINLIRNPNINSNHLFRADISLDVAFTDEFETEIPARITQFKNFDLKTVMVRTMIPRNPIVDKPLDQTCLLYDRIEDTGEVRSLVIYLPHISSPADSPFYHPAVHGIAFMHTFLPSSQQGIVSIQYSFFESEPRSVKLERTAQHLLASAYKHGQGKAAGYVKRVNHDVILPQAVVQNTYARLKSKYARPLIEAWVETTDPGKHVFEDLGIAAFLIELWAEMYKERCFPGFVDIGCGNGLLVHILLSEGYSGWGFDARRRKSWPTYSPQSRDNLKELVLIPSIIQSHLNVPRTPDTLSKSRNIDQQEPIIPCVSPKSEVAKESPKEMKNSMEEIRLELETLHPTDPKPQEAGTHNGIFPKGTFIISNHADELTPWTPILANLSESPFMMIPCCSHSLSGARFRAPPPKDAGVSNSAYASLVVWASKIAKDCGWRIETEMLRIPSTRNTALIGRSRLVPFQDVDARALVDDYGGAVGWEENALKLIKGTIRGH